MNIVFNKTVASAAAMLCALVTLAGCGSSSSTRSSSSTAVDVVASTNVYGDIARTVAGRLAGSRVQITSIISSPDQDPHSYEASASTALQLSKADLVIENGGGYDDFVDTMLDAHGSRGVRVLNAVDISGKKAAEGAELNEHVWYDVPTVARLAARISAAMSAIDPSDAATYAANRATFVAGLQHLERVEATVRSQHQGAGVAITEPVPLYLLQACGLVNRTPPRFSEAIESGDGVSVRVLQQTIDLFRTDQVALLAYNEQTVGPETTKVLDAARTSGVPVVPVTETLPAGKTYLQWMGANLSAVSTALSA